MSYDTNQAILIVCVSVNFFSITASIILLKFCILIYFNYVLVPLKAQQRSVQIIFKILNSSQYQSPGTSNNS